MNTEEARQILGMIEEDSITDSKELEGQPFTGKVVAPEFGKIRAQVAALARILDRVIAGDFQ